ncbi:hypothetical protein BVRB_7g168700 [Beta vulgaris subsp. vulgaris]|nr:hypothetical protein BVRB_7g168700 [Beta vulgaris subsp. vulgaris]
MEALAVVGGILFPSLDESKRILGGKVDYLGARIDDVERASFSDQVQRGTKRKIYNDLCIWVGEGRKLLKVADKVSQGVECGSFLMCAKKRKVVDKLAGALTVHEKKGDILYGHALSDELGPYRGNYLPVKELMGRATLDTLVELEHLVLAVLQDAEVGRIAICGREGIGKTFLMKHLHNSVLKWVERFDYVFWVTSLDGFSIKNVQDAVAAVVKCDLASDDDLNVRARKLSDTFAVLGSFVLFLDGVPEGDLNLDQIGITAPAEGSERKLVLTTSSTFGCRMLDGFGTVELDRLSEKEAMQLFMHEAKIDMASVLLLNNIPSLLAKKCRGVPRMIVDIASRMCGVDDLHEWRNALFELGTLEERSTFPNSGQNS